VLKYQRGVSFKKILSQRRVAITDNPKWPGQRKMLFEYNNYIWVVPFVALGDEIFLKTLYPSRKHTKKYLAGGF
jgi:hypothetical protein